ncbi:hypothetical protein GGX14DRAFT_474454 [Mycena pura]|uniref:Uncharacterized protein n=1 Tax=Mycena pura TaxID=153505 RepID=A0AAD6Y631_9AGAR|nr:hypothetical protein GGX14DRAFT_474454 [Mycena pura]
MAGETLQSSTGGPLQQRLARQSAAYISLHERRGQGELPSRNTARARNYSGCIARVQQHGAPISVGAFGLILHVAHLYSHTDTDGVVLAKLKIPRDILEDSHRRVVSVSAVLVLSALRRSAAAGRSMCLLSEIPSNPIGTPHCASWLLLPGLQEEFWLRARPPLAGPNPTRFDRRVAAQTLPSCASPLCDTPILYGGPEFCSMHLASASLL